MRRGTTGTAPRGSADNAAAAARCVRSSRGLQPAAQRSGLDTAQLRDLLEALPPRGRCAGLAAQIRQRWDDPDATERARLHPAIPPQQRHINPHSHNFAARRHFALSAAAGGRNAAEAAADRGCPPALLRRIVQSGTADNALEAVADNASTPFDALLMLCAHPSRWVTIKASHALGERLDSHLVHR